MDGGPGGTHRGKAGDETEQGAGIGQGSAIGRQGRQQSANLETGAAIGLHTQLHEPKKGCQLHLGVKQTVDGLLQPRKGRLQGGGKPTLGHLGPGDAAKAPAHQLLHGPQAAVGVLVAIPSGQHLLLNAGPGKDQWLDQRLPLRRTARAPLLQQGRQGAIGTSGHGLLEASHHPHAPEIR